MNRFWASVTCLIIFTGTAFSAGARERKIVFEHPQTVVKMLMAGKTQLVITRRQVLQCSGGNARPVFTSATDIRDGQVQGNTLFLATAGGLERLNGSAGYAAQSPLFAGKDIVALAQDNLGRLWVGATYQGAYVQHGVGTDSFDLKIQVPSILSLAAAAGDTSVWVGTNVGLYRVGTGAFSTTRYAEEGYSGYELPDNVVEHLYADALSNVWVLMPDNISFKRGSSFAGEMPTFEFLGDRENHIWSIVAVSDKWYVFVTQKGVSYLPIQALKETHGGPTEEVHSSHGMEARQAMGAQLSVPAIWAGQPIRYAQNAGSTLWLFTDKGGWPVSQKKLLRTLEKGVAK